MQLTNGDWFLGWYNQDNELISNSCEYKLTFLKTFYDKNSKTKDIYTYTAKYANFNDYDLVTNQEVGEIKINKYNGNASTLVIPQFIGGMQVIIGDN